jgi:hypothetical protein
MGTNDEEIQKARQHAQRKFVVELERIAKASQDELAHKRNEMAARGIVLSGAMWKVTADIYKRQIEVLIAARLKTLLDAYDLYGVPLDDEIEKQVLQEVTDLRKTQITNANQATSNQPWLLSGASAYISGELSGIPDPFNAVKVEIEERRHKKAKNKSPDEAPDEALIFVSCGQSTTSERQLGQSVAKLIEKTTGCEAYFAQNQT